MSKRRSSTRIGRKHPAPSVLQRAEAASVTHPPPVISPPFLLGTVICRISTDHTEQVEVQEWASGYWLPSLIPAYRIADRAPAPRELLEARGIPADDWFGHPPRHWTPPQLLPLTGAPARDRAPGDDRTTPATTARTDDAKAEPRTETPARRDEGRSP